MINLKTMVPLLAIILLVPLGLANAQDIPSGEDTAPYALEDIEHSFAVMEGYVVYDENKNITFDLINAAKNHDVTQLDIDIALDFAAHNNDIMDVMIGAVGQVNELESYDAELQRALLELHEGKFRALFGKETEPAGSANEIAYAVYGSVPTPITSAFGASE